MDAKPLSKTARLKQERAARREEKRQYPIRLQAARDNARAACGKLPTEFSAWGVVRTRAFMNMSEILFYRAGLKTVTAELLEQYTRELHSVSTASLERCQELGAMNVRQLIGEPA